MFAAHNALFTTSGITPVQFKGVNTAANLTSGVTTVTIPSHQTGDLILMWVSDVNNYRTLSKPSAGGTVPTWTTIGATTSDDYSRHSIHYAVATASNHTSGTWGNIKLMMAVVLSGQNATSPIGGYALLDTQLTYTVPSPNSSSYSISNSANSQLLFFGCTPNRTWDGTVTTGYTARTSGDSNSVAYRLLTKDDPSTKDSGQITIGTFTTAFSPAGSVAIEIRK